MENYNLISAKIVADSLNQFGERITTMKLIFPRIILAEFNTHRMFNRNSASSRAIPLHKMVKAVEENPFIPIAWQKEHTGMQGDDYIIDEKDLRRIKEDWLEARDNAVYSATQLNNGFNIKDEEGKYVITRPDLRVNRVTKQLCNRLLEPFMYHTVLVTATEWENFFELRCPKYHKPYETIYYRSKKDLLNSLPDVDAKIIKKESTNIDWLQRNKGAAEIHIMDLAEKMWDIYNESEPKQLGEGEWHIPFGDNINEEILFDTLLDLPILDGEIGSPVFDTDIINAKIKVATARCARISYETLGDNPEINYEKDIKLHDDLLAMKHMSPFEHCAVVMNEENYYSHIKTTKAKSFTISNNDDIYIDGPISFKDCGWSRNFKGFKQYREIIE